MAPNTAISMVAYRFRLKFMVPIEMPSWWRATTFCIATEVSEGIGPKPAPIKINVSSNDSGVMLLGSPAKRRDRCDRDEEPIMGRSL